jgi:uncharacterized membrane protein
MKKGMKDQEVDFYRWVIYGLLLLLLAILAIRFPVVIWVFAILLAITVIDIAYCKKYKYSHLR